MVVVVVVCFFFFLLRLLFSLLFLIFMFFFNLSSFYFVIVIFFFFRHHPLFLLPSSSSSSPSFSFIIFLSFCFPLHHLILRFHLIFSFFFHFFTFLFITSVVLPLSFPPFSGCLLTHHFHCSSSCSIINTLLTFLSLNYHVYCKSNIASHTCKN